MAYAQPTLTLVGSAAGVVLGTVHDVSLIFDGIGSGDTALYDSQAFVEAEW